jgi:hypothetical protein
MREGGGGEVILAEIGEDHSPKQRPTAVISSPPLFHIIPGVLVLLTAFKPSLNPGHYRQMGKVKFTIEQAMMFRKSTGIALFFL